MKKFVLVAIGGTGMRVAQSFVALAASGFLSDLSGQDYKLEIRLVDLDIVAGSDKIELEEMIRALNDALPHLSIIVDERTADSRWKPKGTRVGSSTRAIGPRVMSSVSSTIKSERLRRAAILTPAAM